MAILEELVNANNELVMSQNGSNAITAIHVVAFVTCTQSREREGTNCKKLVNLLVNKGTCDEGWVILLL